MCFMIMLDSNIVAVSLPSIARDLGAAFSDIERVVRACRRRCPISALPPPCGSTPHMRAVRGFAWSQPPNRVVHPP
jgi:hypothetical protein